MLGDAKPCNLVLCGADATLRLPLPDTLLFRKLPARGIFQLSGDGEGNRSLKEKDVLGLESASGVVGSPLCCGVKAPRLLDRLGVYGRLC